MTHASSAIAVSATARSLSSSAAPGGSARFARSAIPRALVAILAAGFVCVAHAAGGDSAAQAQMDAANKTADANYKAAKQHCESFKGNDKTTCDDQAEGARDSAKAQAKASYKGTPSDRYDADMEKAKTARTVALDKCSPMSGNDKDVCKKQAQAAYVQSEGQAKVRKAGGDSGKDVQDVQDAQQSAQKDNAEAKSDVAKEKCDSLNGQAKDDCVTRSKKTTQ